MASVLSCFNLLLIMCPILKTLFPEIYVLHFGRPLSLSVVNTLLQALTLDEKWLCLPPRIQSQHRT